MKRSYTSHFAAAAFLTPATRAGDLATVLQYELSFGRDRPGANFYFAYRQDQVAFAATDTGTPDLRLPLYFTDPTMTTTFSGP